MGEISLRKGKQMETEQNKINNKAKKWMKWKKSLKSQKKHYNKKEASTTKKHIDRYDVKDGGWRESKYKQSKRHCEIIKELIKERSK